MANTTVYFAKLNENAIIPSKKDEDAGFDIYACATHPIIIKPGDIVMIPTGICSAFSNDYAMIVKERGSTGTKGLAVRCGVIDSGFRGEWQIVISNVGNKTICIHDEADAISSDWISYPIKKAIAQAIIVETPKAEIIETTHEEIIAMKSERGEGMLGSSNK